MSALQPVLDQIRKIWDRLKLMPVFLWGTVTQSDPLRVQLDGDFDPLLFTPQNPLGALSVGQRVLCVEVHRRVIIIQKKQVDTGWVDLSGYVASGVTYEPDSNVALAGIKAIRHDRTITLSLGNFRIDSMNVPTNGNVSNRLILSDIPEVFRPLGGAAIGAAWNGRVWSGFVSPSGEVSMTAVVPNATATGAETWTDEMYSGTATYLGS